MSKLDFSGNTDFSTKYVYVYIYIYNILVMSINSYFLECYLKWMLVCQKMFQHLQNNSMMLLLRAINIMNYTNCQIWTILAILGLQLFFVYYFLNVKLNCLIIFHLNFMLWYVSLIMTFNFILCYLYGV